jgi:hypothetical protein
MMGYTHYWSHRRQHSAARMAKMLRPLIQHGVEAGVLAGPLGNGVPTPDSPAFNGREDLGLAEHPHNGLAHETFNPAERMQWEPFRQSGFCKTDRKPYDSYVVAALLRLKAVYGKSFEVSTDGHEADWNLGAWDGNVSPRSLYINVYGEEPPSFAETCPDRA